MSQWQVPAVQPAVSIMNANIVYLLLGLFGWEYILTLDIEYAILCRRLSFRWSLIPYIIGRTLLLVYLILLAVGISPIPVKIACLPTTLLTALSGGIPVGCSSTIFAIRTCVIWKDFRLLLFVLFVLSLGLWAVLMIDATSFRAVAEDGACNVYLDNPKLNGATFICTMCYDLLVFLLSVVGLSRQKCRSPLKTRLRTHGILYFAVAGIAYLLPAVFSLLSLNSLMMIFSNIAATTSVIVSSRAVRSLLSFDPSKSSRTQDSNFELTSQIAIHQSVTLESGTKNLVGYAHADGTSQEHRQGEHVFVDQGDLC